MDRINRIMGHPEFQACMQGIRQEELERTFCLHGLDHSLDVARISYIMNLEQQLSFEKDVIYAMALLHDIGRWEEYKNGASHHENSAKLADKILMETGFDEQERLMICEAIRRHRTKGDSSKDLAYLLFKADKLSRKCFDCKMIGQCYWSEEQKNKGITI